MCLCGADGTIQMMMDSFFSPNLPKISHCGFSWTHSVSASLCVCAYRLRMVWDLVGFLNSIISEKHSRVW